MKLKVGNKNLTIRKWKGKDKKKFISALKQKDVKEIAIMDALVYSCIEENVILSTEELKYVLSRIRAISLGEEIKIEFYCKECGSLYTKTFKLKDIIKYSYKELNEIISGKIKIKLGEIKNKEIYLQKVAEDDIYDLLFRIESINNDDTFTLQELEEKLDDLDIDILTDIIQQYNESKFTVKDINTVKCSCGKETRYKFDEIPGFFPSSWFE